MADCIPATSFQVDDLDAEFSRLRDLGVEFTQALTEAVNVRVAVLSDIWGNLIQLVEMLATA